MKKLLSIVLAMVLMLSMSVSAMAQTPNSKVRVINNSANISAREIKEIVNDVSASFVYDDGTAVPVESIVTIDDITPTDKLRNGNGEKTYRVTARSTVEADVDSKNDEGVAAIIYLSLTWEDVAGTSNTFESVEGNVDITEGKIRTSNVSYGNLGQAGSHKTLQLGTKTSFYKDVNIIAFTPTASYVVYFQGAKFQLNVGVTASF